MSSNLVFSDEFIQSLRSKFDGRKRYERSEIYHYAIESYYQGFRNEVEGLYLSIPDELKSQILSRLHSNDHFIETYNELITKSFLQLFATKIEYEKEFIINGKCFTPDWFVTSESGTEFIVECFTVNPSANYRKEIKKQGELLVRLQELQHNVFISMKLTSSNIEFPTQKESKKLVNRLDNWLSGKPRVGKQLEANNINFEVVEYTTKQKITLLGPIYTFRTDTSNLKDKIKEKARAYKTLNLPLIVAIVPTFYSFLSLEEVIENLDGKESVRISYNDDEIVGEELVRDQSGLFYKNSKTLEALSGVMYIPKDLGQELQPNQVIIFPNPRAKYPLDINDFKSS